MNQKSYFRIIMVIAMVLMLKGICPAQSRSLERLFIATDRPFYVAGESIWLSLYCFDLSISTYAFSSLSVVAYIELRDAESLLSTAKLRIHNGRGSGRLELPLTLPTGNYRLLAYTKQMLNEEYPAYYDAVIPVYNTLSLEQNDDRVTTDVDRILTMNMIAPSVSNDNGIEIRMPDGKETVKRNSLISVSLLNTSEVATTLNVSVHKWDPHEPPSLHIVDYLSEDRTYIPNVHFSNKYVSEYEGEVIRGKISMIELSEAAEKSVFLSAVGQNVDVYASPIDTVSGELVFFTNSLYGNREVALDFPYENKNEAVFELYDPFVKPTITPIPKLFLDKKLSSSLEERSIEMQLFHRFGIDTLYDQIYIDDDPLLYEQPVVYDLDDYTRFPDMQDVMIEFVKEIRFRKMEGKPTLQIAVETDLDRSLLSQGPLVVVDGIALFDHTHIFNYDPLKVKTISVYRNWFYKIGTHHFGGIAKFNTYSGHYQGLTFGGNVKIFDYQGVQYPCRFTGREVVKDPNLPDIRSLLYWDPQVDIEPQSQQEIHINTSSVPGRYVVVVEGITGNGKPLFIRSEFVVQ